MKPTTTPLPEDQIRATLATVREGLEGRSAPASSTRGPRSLTALEAHILAEADRVMAGWLDEGDNRARLAQPTLADLPTLRSALNRLVAGPAFDGVRTMLATQRRLDPSDISFPIKSLTFGFAAQGDFVIGVYGSVGYLVDPTDPLNGSKLYVCGAAEEGLVAGADVAVQVGIWRQAVDDVGGYYNGQSIEVDDTVGFAAYSLESDETLQAVMIDVTGGVDDGIDEVEFLFATLSIGSSSDGNYPIAQDDAAHMIILTKLECDNINSVGGHDEVYMLFNSAGSSKTHRHPYHNYYAMDASTDDPEHVWACGRSVKTDNQVTVTLHDGDDVIASFVVNINPQSPATGAPMQPGVPVPFPYDRPGNLGNGYNEVSYTLTAMLVY